MSDEPELRWHDLATEPPPGNRPIIMFPIVSDGGHMFEVHQHFYTVSNPEYARLHALEQGYTHWFPIPPHPDEAKVEALCEAFRSDEALRQREYYRGFAQAVAVIAERAAQWHPALGADIREHFKDITNSAEQLPDAEPPGGLSVEEYDLVYRAALGRAACYIATDAEFRERAEAIIVDAQERLAKLRPNRPDALDWR